MNDRKVDILEAALDEFSTSSYDEASINAIIKNSKTSKGTFYHYFTNKSDLYIQLMKYASQVKWEYIQQSLSDAPEANVDDVLDLLKRQAEQGIRFAEQFPRYAALSKQLLKEKENGNAIFSLVQDKLAVDYTDKLKPLLAEAYEAGQFNRRFSLEFIVKTMEYLLNHFDDIYFTPAHNIEDRLDALNTLIDFLKSGFSN